MNVAVAMPDSLDGLQLNRALEAGIARLLSCQEHLDRINVFPVPDGDTGTNLAITMTAVLGAHVGPGMLIVGIQEYEPPK
jgi:dihydroxyacetone kinase-like predicted kinase